MAEEKKESPKEAMPKDLMGFLDYWLVKKAPFQIPDKGREWIVKFGPWITLVLLVLFAPMMLAALGLATFLSPFSVGMGVSFGLATITLAVQLVLMVMALPGLFARKMSGWTFLFYSEIVNLAYGIVSGTVLSTLVSVLIGLYILFQIRSLYTK